MREIKMTTYVYGAILVLLIVGGYIALRFPFNSAMGNLLSVKAEEAPDQAETGSIDLPSFMVQTAYTEGITRRPVLNTTIPKRPQTDVSVYEVNLGDNLFLIADKFNLKPETVLWGNYEVIQDNPQFLQPGQELNILPVDGVYYQWAENDDLTDIADYFGVELQEILEYPGNRVDIYDVDTNVSLFEVGDWVIVPGGKRALKDWGPPAIARTNPAVAAYYGAGACGSIYEGAIGTGSFVWPTMGTYISGYDYNPNLHPGIDIAGAVGNAIFATDSGVVVYSGWSEYGYGNMIVIDHGNGWQSAYAHMSNVAVSCGQSATIGTYIGGVGNTGNSSGAHLHFELRNAQFGKVNPWNYVSP
jgi:murein DD-endopeptidase MepM/ murein hydrolase activator NlpD